MPLALVVFLVTIPQVGISDARSGVDEARARMQALTALVGTFDLHATETGTDGSMFVEVGTRTCRWALGDAAILCEDARTLREARGRYENLATHRRSIRLIRWNRDVGAFEQVSIGLAGAPGVQRLTYDPARRTLAYVSTVQSQSMGLTLTNESTLTIEADAHALVQHLRAQTTDFAEEYRETAKRAAR